MDDNKKKLLKAFNNSKVVLFLGAGAVAGSTIGKEQKDALLGNALSKELCKAFFPEEVDSNDTLHNICRDINNIYGRDALRDKLIDLLTPVNPSSALKQIPLIQWAAIYTTNVDDAIERAYEETNNITQKLFPVVLPADQDAENSLTEVSYYKLHGCLLKPESNLIFSHNDYTESREINLRLFSRLESHLCNNTFLFIGFSLEDSDFQMLWKNIIRYSGGKSRLHTTFLVDPFATQRTIQSLAVEDIAVIKDGVETFIPWLKSNLIEASPSIQQRLIEQTAPSIKWFQDNLDIDPPPELVSELEKCCENLSQLPKFHRDNLSSRFYLGNRADWGDIQNGLPIPRELEAEIVEDIESWIKKPKSKYSLLLGAAGYGKTTLLMRVAYNLANTNYNLTILWVKNYERLNSVTIAEFCKILNKPVILFIDDAYRHINNIRKLKNDAIEHKFKLYIILSSRPSDWHEVRKGNSLEVPNQWSMTRLSDQESLNLARKVRKSGKLSSNFSTMSEMELKDHFINYSEKHIIAGLLTATSENTTATNFEDVIADEYFRINDEQNREIYLLVALVHALDSHMPITLISKLINTPIIEYHEKHGAALDEIVIENNDISSGEILLSTQHRVIAETLIQKVINPAGAVENIYKLAQNIDPHNHLQYGILIRLYQEDFLRGILKQPGPVRSCFESLIELFPSDPFIKQHYAIFESQEKKFEHAINLIDEALSSPTNDPHFLNTKANIWLREAINEPDQDKAEYLLKKGTGLIKNRIKIDSDKEVHYLSLIEKLLSWGKRRQLKETKRLSVLEEAQAALDDALRIYPTSSEMLTVAGKLDLFLNDTPNAEKNLVHSIKLDQGNIRAILLLARILVKNIEYEKALEYIKGGLNYDQRSAGLLKLNLDCLKKLDRPWIDIKKAYINYLKIVDKDYKIRLLFAKDLIEHRERDAARKQIDCLTNADMPFKDRIRNSHILYNDKKQPMVLEGTYDSHRIGKGFISVDGFPKKLGIFVDIRRLPRNFRLHNGKRIKCNVGINCKGLFLLKIAA